MDPRDLLLTIAEVAIAFAGFASLAAVLATRSERTAMANAMRLRSLLIYSLATVAFCFVPFVPSYYGLSTTASWNLSSLLLAVFVGCANLLLTRYYGGANPTKVPIYRLIPWLASTWLPIALVVLGLLGVGTIIGNYILALLTMLLTSAASFLGVIAALLVPFHRD